MSDGSIVAETMMTWLLGGVSSLAKVLGHQSGEWQLRVTWFVARASSSGLVPGGRAGGGWEGGVGREYYFSLLQYVRACLLFFFLLLNKSGDLLGVLVLFFFPFLNDVLLMA